MRAFVSLFILTLIAVAFSSPVRAQEEGVPKVIDEVIAQVNDQVITLSMLKREMVDAAAALKQQQPSLSDQQAQAEVAKRQPEIIATLINEQLLLQKGKELNLSDDVEGEVNKRMLAVMNDQGFKSIEVLETEMRKAGIDPATVRQSLRVEIMKNYVLGGEVDRKIYLGLTDSEVKSYYEAHKDKFRKPETVTLSEIYLSTVGKDEAEVRARADKLVAQLRAGADFGSTAAVQSEREDKDGKRVAPQTKGEVGTFPVDQVTRPEIATAIKDLKVGGISAPIKTDGGYIILRVNARTPAGDAVFNDSKVREAITLERLDKEHDNYLTNLRKEAYVEIAPSYREAVAPLLKMDVQKAANNSVTTPTSKKDEKKKKSDKKP